MVMRSDDVTLKAGARSVSVNRDRPSAIHCSASRREAAPARAMALAMRSPSLRLGRRTGLAVARQPGLRPPGFPPACVRRNFSAAGLERPAALSFVSVGHGRLIQVAERMVQGRIRCRRAFAAAREAAQAGERRSARRSCAEPHPRGRPQPHHRRPGPDRPCRNARHPAGRRRNRLGAARRLRPLRHARTLRHVRRAPSVRPHPPPLLGGRR